MFIFLRADQVGVSAMRLGGTLPDVAITLTPIGNLSPAGEIFQNGQKQTIR